MLRIVFILGLLHIVHIACAQSPQVQQLLKQADTKKGQPAYAALLLQADSLASGDMPTQALINNKLGMYYFSLDPDKSIHHLRIANSYYSLLGDIPNKALTTQNLAFAHDEGKFAVAAAIPYAEQALDMWKELNDTLQMANMYKYLGLLQGKTSRGALARKNIDTAIELYRAKNYEPGVAVSWHNLAIVYQYARSYDSAISYINRAKDYWRTNDSSRVFELNNLALEINTTINNLEAAKAAYRENLALFCDKFYWRDRLVFYNLSTNYLRAAGDEKGAAAAADKFKALYSNLQKKGIIKNGG